MSKSRLPDFYRARFGGAGLAAVLCGLSLAAVGAENGSPFFGKRVNAETLAVQEKVEALFQQGEFERARFIYENELAPLGDKYAQYMVGYMYLTGTGVEEDAIAASAWYRLAAERSYPEFVEVRDELLRSFSEPDLVRSDDEYRELRRRYSDLVILERLVREDLRSLAPVTGSRLPGATHTVTIIDPRSGNVLPAQEIHDRTRERIEDRLRLIDTLMTDVDVETDVDRLDLDTLRAQIDGEIERIRDRASDSRSAGGPGP